MQVILCIVTVLFSGLSLIAAVSQIIKSEKKPASALMMITGSLLLIAAMACNMAGEQWDLILAFLGCAAVCAAAILNGIKGERLRIALSIILIIGFAVL